MLGVCLFGFLMMVDFLFFVRWCCCCYNAGECTQNLVLERESLYTELHLSLSWRLLAMYKSLVYTGMCHYYSYWTVSGLSGEKHPFASSYLLTIRTSPTRCQGLR